MRSKLNKFIFVSRWILYPINVGLLAILTLYIAQFLYNDVLFIKDEIYRAFFSEKAYEPNMEHMMLALLGFVDAFMVANLIIMIVQGSHQIFIDKFDVGEHINTPEYLDHIDTGILKVKIALSISNITLVQMLKDFVNMEHVSWELAKQRVFIHIVSLGSALAMAIIWRITHAVQKN